MKYIILHSVCQGIERVYPIIFPEYLTHSIVAENMQQAVRKETQMNTMVYSAGFCHIYKELWRCERGSESLGIKRGHASLGYQDYKILNMPNAMQGLML